MEIEAHRQREVGERLRELRTEARLTQDAISDLIGVTARAYQKWEAGAGGLRWANEERVAQVLTEALGREITPDYIARGPINTETLEIEALRLREVGERLKALRTEARLTQMAIAERVGVTPRAYQSWEGGEGGMAWKNEKAVAKVLTEALGREITPDYIARGPRDAETPDPFEGSGGELSSLETRLDELSAKVDQVLQRLGG